MTLELRVMSGRRSGVRERFDKSVVSVGRHPLSDLRFDPYHDLDVSTRHAELRGIEGVWTIHDEGSTNGTFVNGQRVEGERVVREGDLITFGANGPRVEVHITTAMPVATPEEHIPTIPSAAMAGRTDVADRVAEAVEAQTRVLRHAIAVGLVVIVVLAALGVYLWTARR